MIRNAKILGAGVTNETYRAQAVRRGDPAYVMGRSDLVDFLACPHKWLMTAGVDDETSSTEWGSLVDALLFGTVADRYAIAPQVYADDKGKPKPWNYNATVCKEWRDAQHAAGKIVVKQETWEAAQIAAGRLRDDPVAGPYIAGADHQVMATAEWADNDTGIVVPVKILVDIVPRAGCGNDKQLADLKTTKCASPDEWPRTIYNFGYHVQAAMYLDVFNAATGEARNLFAHVAQDNELPFEIGRHLLSEDWLLMGRHKYETALRLYARCIKDQCWPGYMGEGEDWAICQPEPWMILRSGHTTPDPTANW